MASEQSIDFFTKLKAELERVRVFMHEWEKNMQQETAPEGIEEFLHVDDFIDDPSTDKYASFVLEMHRWPAAIYYKVHGFIEENELYCTYKDKRYKVGGCSTMGDVWLLEMDDPRKRGYNHRVNVALCSEWSKTP